MKTRALRDVKSVLEDHAKPRTLDELAAEGKKSVRVVTGEEFLKIIQTIVDEAIHSETSTVKQADRDRIVDEARSKVGLVARLQAEAGNTIRKQQEQLRKIQQRARDSEKRAKDLQARLDEAAAKELRAAEEFKQLLETARGDDGLNDRLASLEHMVRDLAAHNGNGTPKDASVEALIRQIAERDTGDRRLEVLESAVRQIAHRDQDADRLANLESMVRALADQRPGDDRVTALEGMIVRLAEQGAEVKQDFDARLQTTLDKTLDAIDKTVRSATARPIDHPVEATDSLLGQLLDDQDSLESNYDRLDVDETASTTVKDAVERLRQARRGQKND